MERCFTCEIVTEYVDLANQFTQDLSAALIGPMQVLFVAIAGLWVVIQGLRLMAVQTTLFDVGKEMLFVLFAWALLVGQGPELVNEIYQASLSMMGSAAAVALKVGSSTTASAANEAGSSLQLGAGMTALVKTAETSIKPVFEMAWSIAKTSTALNWLPTFYAVALIIPYFFVLVIYFAQVVVSIFRIIMISILSPYLMLGFGFNWGRGMAVAGVKTLLSAFMVLFGSTAAVAIMVYGVNALNVGAPPPDESLRDWATVTSPKYMLVVVLGWLGTAFLAEAVGIANSITGSVLSNWGAGVITAGATLTGGLALKWSKWGADVGGTPFRTGATWAGRKAGGAAKDWISEQAAEWVKRAKKE